MNKSIVVINTPENCKQCPFEESPWSFCLGEYEKEKHCPLRSMPQKNFEREAEAYQTEEEYNAYVDGWNDCLNEITGEYE